MFFSFFFSSQSVFRNQTKRKPFDVYPRTSRLSGFFYLVGVTSRGLSLRLIGVLSFGGMVLILRFNYFFAKQMGQRAGRVEGGWRRKDAGAMERGGTCTFIRSCIFFFVLNLLIDNFKYFLFTCI